MFIAVDNWTLRFFLNSPELKEMCLYSPISKLHQKIKPQGDGGVNSWGGQTMQ